jgi:hypothetical protein
VHSRSSINNKATPDLRDLILVDENTGRFSIGSSVQPVEHHTASVEGTGLLWRLQQKHPEGSLQPAVGAEQSVALSRPVGKIWSSLSMVQ